MLSLDKATENQRPSGCCKHENYSRTRLRELRRPPHYAIALVE